MKKALLILWLFALPAISQSDSVTSIPGDPTVFVITLKSSGEALYGAIKFKGAYLEGEYPKDDSNLATMIEVVHDIPGELKTSKVSKADIRYAQPESGPLRLKRYNDAGYVVVEGGSGGSLLISERLVAQAERLKELQQEQQAQEAQQLAPYQQTTSTSAASVQPAGFATLWGPHIATVLIAGILLVIVWKLCF